MDDLSEDGMPSKRDAAWRGFKGVCPKCGEAKLFRAYLKQVDHCPSCGAAWGEVRADDAPAWATMLVVGHVLALAFHVFIFRLNLGVWAGIAALCTVVTVMSLLLLPRMKGFFIAWIWRTGSLQS